MKFLSLLGLLVSVSAWAAPVTDSLPVQFTRHGTNCWNAAFVHAGVASGYRFVSAEEFLTVARSSVCKEIPAPEAVPGDIRVYYRSVPNLVLADQAVHANVFFSREQSINKKDLYLTSPITLESQRNVDLHYGNTLRGTPLLTKEGKTVRCEGEECGNHEVFYRCGAIADSLKAENAKLFHLYRGISEELSYFSSFDHKRQFNFSSLKTVTKNFKDAVESFCGKAMASFSCEYYPKAVASFESQFALEQPSEEWLAKYFEAPKGRAAADAVTHLPDILAAGDFGGRFTVCPAQESVFAYLRQDRRRRKVAAVWQDSSRDFAQWAKIDAQGVKSLSFSPDCSGLEVALSTGKILRFDTSVAYQKSPVAEAAFEVKSTSLSFGESRISIASDGKEHQLFENETGRFTLLGRSGGGVYVFQENLINQSIFFIPVPGLMPKLVASFKPKVAATVSKVNLPHRGKRILPAYLLSSPRATDTLLLHVHGGGCWMTSHVDPVNYSPEAYDFLKAGYDFVTISYVGDDDAAGAIPDVKNCGQDEMEDLVAAVHFASALYKNVYLIGESYGAYLINLAVGRHPKLPIAGAISKSGVWSLSLQKAKTPGLRRLEASELTDPELHIAKIRAPLLLFHGQRDEAVDYGNALVFQNLAKKNGVEYTSFTPDHTTHVLDPAHPNALVWHKLLLDFVAKHRR